MNHASRPPNEARSSPGAFAELDLHVASPPRWQLMVALVLASMLVVVPLYMWRRPRPEPILVTVRPSEPAPPPASEAPARPIASDASVLSCQDPGPGRTAPEACDRVASLEAALFLAVEASASCAPGATVEYVADISFKKKIVSVVAKDPQASRSAKTLAGCERAVKTKLTSLSWATIKHEHARYRLGMTATYPDVGKF